MTSNLHKLLGIILVLLALTVFANNVHAEYIGNCEYPQSAQIYEEEYRSCGGTQNSLYGYNSFTGTSYGFHWVYKNNGTYIKSPPEGCGKVIISGSQYKKKFTCPIGTKIKPIMDIDLRNELTTKYNFPRNITPERGGANGCEKGEPIFERINNRSGYFYCSCHEKNNDSTFAYICEPNSCLNEIPVNSCDENNSPEILNISNKTINYKEELFIDLNNYISDSDDSKEDLNLSVNSTKCQINNYELNCSSQNIENINVEINVQDPCGSVSSENFNLEITNKKPIFDLPNKTIECNSETLLFENIINLKNYVVDEDKELIDFNLLSQTSNNINCYIENDYLFCESIECSNTSTTITINANDVFDSNQSSQTTINFNPPSPEWINKIDYDKNLPVKCLNNNQEKIIDLRDYVNSSNVKFTLDQNSNTVNCFIDDENYISCENISNKQTTNILEVTATNNSGSDTTYMQIKTNCNSQYIFESQKKEIYMDSCTDSSVPVFLENNSYDKKCFDFDLDHANYLNASISNKAFCLNSNESTTLYLNINTCNADNDFYDIEVFDYEKELSMDFDLFINKRGDFRINAHNGKICSGETKTFNIEVDNRTDLNQEIELNAENYILLPYFKNSTIYLEENESSFEELTINARGAEPGKYNILLGGDATNIYVEKSFELEVVNCANLKETNFVIESPQVCYDVSKGQTFNGSFTVRRTNCQETINGYNTKALELYTTGLTTELSKNYLNLECSEENKINFRTEIPKNAKAGNHFIEVIGQEKEDLPFDDEIGQVQSKEICLNVLGTSQSNILLETKTQNIPWCESKVFELTVFNTGDFKETLDLSVENLPMGVDATLSETQIIVESGKRKTIYVSVSTSPDSDIQNNQTITIRLKNEEEIDFTTKVYFNIIENVEFDDIEILYSNKLILTKANSTTQYELLLRNNTKRTFYNIKINAENMPDNTIFEEQTISEFSPGETITVGGNISLGDVNGYFTPSFVIKKDIVLNKKKFGLSVENEENNIFAGLFGFGVTETGILLSLFLILLVLLIILTLTNSSTIINNKEEKWVKNE